MLVCKQMGREGVETIVTLHNHKDMLVSVYYFYKINSGMYVLNILLYISSSLNIGGWVGGVCVWGGAQALVGGSMALLKFKCEILLIHF